MTKKDELEECVYSKVREIKQKFYDCKSADEWQTIKNEFIEVLSVAETKMDNDFYTTYKDGVIASIKKMYDFKVKYWKKNEKKTYQPKVTYLFQDDLAQALTRYIKIQTKMLELDYEARCGAKLQEECL